MVENLCVKRSLHSFTKIREIQKDPREIGGRT
jgi:hypothetical protein